MSEATPDPDEALLGELAELDMALARHVNGQALATTDPDTLNGLGRTAQRLARSVRQTLALKARLTRERISAEARAEILQPRPVTGNPAYDELSEQADLEAAVEPRIRAEYEPLEAEAIEDALGELVYEEWTEPFAALGPGEQADRIMARIRELFPRAPQPASAPQPAPAREPASTPGPPPAAPMAATLHPEPEPSPAPAPDAEPERDPEPEPPPAPEPSPDPPRPDPPPPDPPPEPYVPPWERGDPRARRPDGSGW